MSFTCDAACGSWFEPSNVKVNKVPEEYSLIRCRDVPLVPSIYIFFFFMLHSAVIFLLDIQTYKHCFCLIDAVSPPFFFNLYFVFRIVAKLA